ncbi:MAG: hypothetical protein AAGL19_19450, partial [Pseudomonadota bacterium]
MAEFEVIGFHTGVSFRNRKNPISFNMLKTIMVYQEGQSASPTRSPCICDAAAAQHSDQKETGLPHERHVAHPRGFEPLASAFGGQR